MPGKTNFYFVILIVVSGCAAGKHTTNHLTIWQKDEVSQSAYNSLYNYAPGYKTIPLEILAPVITTSAAGTRKVYAYSRTINYPSLVTSIPELPERKIKLSRRH